MDGRRCMWLMSPLRLVGISILLSGRNELASRLVCRTHVTSCRLNLIGIRLYVGTYFQIKGASGTALLIIQRDTN